MKFPFALTMTIVITGILWMQYGFGAAMLCLLLAIIVFLCTAVEVNDDEMARIDRIVDQEHHKTR